MSIILEGADNSGKTTLGKELRQLNPHLEYFHSGSAPSNPAHEIMCLDQQHAMAARPQMIVDRVTCISQQVYADRLFESALMSRLDLLLEIGALIVYCRPSTDHLMSFERFTWRDEESEQYKQLVIANQHRFIHRYDQIMQRIPHLEYDYGDEMTSAWLRKMLAEASSNQMTYHRLQDVMMASVLK